MIYLEYRDEASSKFWTVSVDGAEQTVRYGKIGAKGRSKTKSFDSEADARADAEAQADKKRKKGYEDTEPPRETSEAPTAKKPMAKKPTAKKPAPKKKATTKKSAAKKKPPAARTIKSFFKAIGADDIERVKKELGRGLDADLVRVGEDGDPTFSALHYACYHGRAEIALLLLEHGADATRLEDGAGPLFYAPSGEVARKLIEAGADAAAVAANGVTPLHYVRNAEVAKVLVDAGAPLELEAWGQTPYERTTDIAIRQVLLDAGAVGLRETQGQVTAFASEQDCTFADISTRGAAMGVGADGSIWIGSSSQLYRIAGGKVRRYELPNYGSVASIGAARGVTYFTTNQGLYRYHDGELRQYTATTSPLHDNHIVASFVLDDELWCIGYEAEAETKHVSVFDGENWRLLRPGHELPADFGVQNGMRDSAGHLVFGGMHQSDGFVTQVGDQWRHENFGKDFFVPTVYALTSGKGYDYFATHTGLFARAGDGELKKIYDEALDCLAWQGDTLWGTKAFGKPVTIRDETVTVLDADALGFEPGNTEGCIAYGDQMLIADGGQLYIGGEGGFESIGQAPPDPAAWRSEPTQPLPSVRFVDPSQLPAELRELTLSVTGCDAEDVRGLLRPAIAIAANTGAPAGQSKIGGRPDLPAGFEWPRLPELDDHMTFILQLNLAQLAPLDLEGVLPKQGLLSLFADTDPESEESAWFYFEGDVSPAELPEDLVSSTRDDHVAELPEHALTFRSRWTLPSRDWFEQHLSDDDIEAIQPLRELIDDDDETQLLGWPRPVQGELLSGTETVVLLQLGAILAELSPWITDGLRYWFITPAALETKQLDAIWSEYQYT
jgi:predicted DNA-binding WGR domain protein/uncharacterized protein YwqG